MMQELTYTRLLNDAAKEIEGANQRDQVKGNVTMQELTVAMLLEDAAKELEANQRDWAKDSVMTRELSEDVADKLGKSNKRDQVKDSVAMQEHTIKMLLEDASKDLDEDAQTSKDNDPRRGFKIRGLLGDITNEPEEANQQDKLKDIQEKESAEITCDYGKIDIENSNEYK